MRNFFFVLVWEFRPIPNVAANAGGADDRERWDG